MASFCLYMMQAPMLRGMKGIWMLRGWEVRSWAGFWGVMIGMFVLIQGAAFIMHDKYELPVQRRLRSFALRKTVRAAAHPETLRTTASG
jgi:peptidoglycan/LPS O-acetylase OafA/YrhL